VKDLGYALAYNTRIIGTPEQIADRIEEWLDAGIDGINFMYQTVPHTFAEFVDHVIPVLQERGIAQREYAPGTLRERMFPGGGPTLNDRHPARRYHGAFAKAPPLAATGT
jgi:hypothetical protein